MAERQRLMDEWEEWCKGKAEWLAWAAEGRAKLLREREAEGPFTVEEVEVEETLGKPTEEDQGVGGRPCCEGREGSVALPARVTGVEVEETPGKPAEEALQV